VDGPRSIKQTVALPFVIPPALALAHPLPNAEPSGEVGGWIAFVVPIALHDPPWLLVTAVGATGTAVGD
jgi:hypothetical protein